MGPAFLIAARMIALPALVLAARSHSTALDTSAYREDAGIEYHRWLGKLLTRVTMPAQSADTRPDPVLPGEAL
jgi:hypothetical protein